jgi:hypothetical protein
MSEPRWHEADPRPTYGGGPGSGSRPSRRDRGSGAYRGDPASPRPDAAPRSFGQDRGPSRRPRDGDRSRPDPELYMPDPYRPDEDPAFYPDETGPRPRRRDRARRDADLRDSGRADPGRGPGAGRRVPEPPAPGPGDPGRRDPGRRDPARRDPGRREAGRSVPEPSDRALRDPATPRDRALREPGTQDVVLPDPGYQPDPRSRDWGQIKPGQIEPRQRGPRRSKPGPNGPGRDGTGRDGTGRRRQSSPAGPSWRWGELSGGRATLIVLAAAVIGTGVTVAMHHDPGYLLGGAVIAGTLAAVLAVRRDAVYQLIPVPALAYLVGALAAGLMHEQNAGPSPSGLAVSATQWVAGGFVTMAVATGLAVAVTVIRWQLNRRGGNPGRPAQPEPEPLDPDRPTSRTVFPSGPETGSWRARPKPRPASGPEPPSWPWPEEPVSRNKRAGRREPAPPTEPFFRPRSPSQPDTGSRPRTPPQADPGSRPRPQPDPPSRPRSPSRADPPTRADPASRPGPPSFGAPRDLTTTGRPPGWH